MSKQFRFNKNLIDALPAHPEAEKFKKSEAAETARTQKRVGI